MTRTWDYSGITEVTIDRPARHVWPYFFEHKEKLWDEQHYTKIAGELGKVGEIYMQTFPGGGQVFMEAIKVKPEKQLVLKLTYRENEKSESRLVGYDLHVLNEVAGRTTVVFQQVFALPVDALTVDMGKNDLELATEKQDKTLAHIFQNLKRMVEDSR